MKAIKLTIMLFTILILNSCAKQEPVAMNLYDPSADDVEGISGISVVITQEMIDNAMKK
jgi:PBP1b-binding outer membrane lipoprotein LpoB